MASEGKLKKQKTADTHADRLSALGDDLLLHILSLFELKGAVGTSALSRRWRYLWTRLTRLDLDDSSFVHPADDREIAEIRKAEFANLVVLSVLRQCEDHRPFLKNFRLSCNAPEDPFLSKSWMEAAAGPQIETFEVDFGCCTESLYDLSDRVFALEKLRVLKLRKGFRLGVDDAAHIWLPCLKVLELREISGSSSTLRSLISGSPVLETLGIERFRTLDDATTVYIESSSLKNVKLRGLFMFGNVLPRIVVNAPSLVHMDFHPWHNPGAEYVVHELPCLESGYIDHCGRLGMLSPLILLLNRISNARKLQLTDSTFQCPSPEPLEVLWDPLEPDPECIRSRIEGLVSRIVLTQSPRVIMASEDKLKNTADTHVDRLSVLGDDLLLHILGFLELKGAVGTSALSRRWRYLWTRLTNLHLDDCSFVHSDADWTMAETMNPEFGDLVESVLRQCEDHLPFLKKFRLSCNSPNDLMFVGWWMEAVTGPQVESFEVDFRWGNCMYHPCERIFAMEKLRVLKLNDWYKNGRSSVCVLS
ncbi:unnamed protein product [Linum tenue]|uniref:F-box domain-containing protein n=1 Tax=Linum tenue TaxID=586396 RepID=A0AAV0LSK6_9ROSI|nr:unnamed protein product [Linum tenue]